MPTRWHVTWPRVPCMPPSSRSRFRAALVALCVALLGAAAWQARRSLRGIDTLLRGEGQIIATLRQTESSFNEAQRMAQVGNWVHDLATGSLS